jgi:hypothetical protein
MPTKNITVIESEEIGIVGAGEGSTPHFVDLLEILNIPVSTFLKEAGATLKTSIKFTNWNNEGSDDFYHHSFKPFGNVATQGYQQEPRYLQDVPSIYVTGSYLGVNQRDYDVHAKLSKENKVSPEKYSDGDLLHTGFDPFFPGVLTSAKNNSHAIFLILFF